jgi:hypothetical protein
LFSLFNIRTMKKIFFLALLFIGMKSFGQGNIPLGSPLRTVEVLGKIQVDSLFILPNRTDTLFSGPVRGAVVFAYGSAWVYSGTQWARLSGIAWGTIPGLLANQIDLMDSLNNRQFLLANGYGWKIGAGRAGIIDTTNFRKVDSVWRLNDSTLNFAINGHTYNVLLRGTAGGSIVSGISLTTPTGVFNNPATFTNTGGNWSATLSLINQSANAVFAGPTIGSPGIPAFRFLVAADMPTGIPSSNLSSNTIGFTTGTSGTDINWSAASAALGGGIVLNSPNASSTARGPLTASDWIRFVNKVDSITQSGDTVYRWSNGGQTFCFVITGASGITSLNGLLGATQTFAYGTSGTAFNIVSTGTTHTFNTPLASGAGVTNGGISNTDYGTFSGKQPQLSGTGYSKWAGTTPSYLTPTQVTADLNLANLSLQGLVPPAPHNGMKLGVVGGVLTWQDSTAGGGSGNTNSNIGSGFRWAIPGTNNLKTLFCVGCTIDSITNTNALTITVSGGTTFANPSASIGATAVNGSATTAMRSDAAPPIATNAVTNTLAAQAPTNTIKSNLTGGTANEADNTLSAVATALAPVMPTTPVNAARGLSATVIGGNSTVVMGWVPGQPSLDSIIRITLSNAFDFIFDSVQNHLKVKGMFNAGANTVALVGHLTDSSEGNVSPAQATTFIASGSGGGTTNFLRADGTWAAPAGGGGGSSLTRQSITSGISVTGTTANSLVTFNFPAPISGFAYTFPLGPSDQQVVEFEAGGTLVTGTEITTLTLIANSGQNIIYKIPFNTVDVGDHAKFKWNASISSWVTN